MGIIGKATHNRLNKILVPACETGIKLCGNLCVTTLLRSLISVNAVFHVMFVCWSQLVSICFILSGTDGTVSCAAAYFVCNLIFSDILAHAGDANVGNSYFLFFVVDMSVMGNIVDTCLKYRLPSPTILY